MTRRRWWTRLTRDLIVFLVALGLLIREAFGAGRPEVLTVYMLLLVSPVPLRYDDWRRRNDREGET